MTERVEALEQAKALTAEERAELLEELSGESTEDIAKAWADEAVGRGDEATASGDRGERWEWFEPGCWRAPHERQGSVGQPSLRFTVRY